MQSATNDGATLRVATTAHHVNAPTDSIMPRLRMSSASPGASGVLNPLDDLRSAKRSRWSVQRCRAAIVRRAVEEAHLTRHTACRGGALDRARRTAPATGSRVGIDRARRYAALECTLAGDNASNRRRAMGATLPAVPILR